MIYVRCIKCSYNNVAKGIRLLDKKAFFLFIQEKNFMQVRAFKRYIKDIYFFEVNTKYISSSVLKTSEFS